MQDAVCENNTGDHAAIHGNVSSVYGHIQFYRPGMPSGKNGVDQEASR